MSRFVRFARALAGAAVLAVAAAPAPGLADAARPVADPGRPTAVVVRIDGGFDPENRWLWYEQDGTARFEGILSAQRGRFRSHVDYAKVEKLLSDAGLCSGPDTLVRPAGMDVFVYRVSVRCGDGWRIFTAYDAQLPAHKTQVRDAVRELERLASTLAWQPASEDVTPPDLREKFRPAQPQSP